MKSALAFLSAVVLAAAVFAAQPWVEEYERGLAAVAAGDWAKAAVAMQSAARQNPTEAVTLKLRRRTVSYVPWYWLGVAQLASGDPAAALQSLRRSEAQGVIEKTALYGEFRKALARAEGTAASPRSGGPAANAAFQNAVKAAVAAQGKAMLAGATRNETYRKATLKLQESRDRAKGGTPEALADGAKLASQAEEMFRSAAAEQAAARKTSRTVRATMQPSAEPVPGATETVAAAPVVPVDADPPQPSAAAEPGRSAEPIVPAAPSPRLVERTGSMLRSLRKEAGAEPARANPRIPSRGDLDQIEMRLLAASTDDEVTLIQREIARELEEVRAIVAAARVPSPPSAAGRAETLAGAYRALAAGRPEDAERMLSELLASEDVAEAYLLRGCARYTEGTLTRRKALLDAARDDLARALRMNAKLRLDEKSFSPKLVELLAEVRRGM